MKSLENLKSILSEKYVTEDEDSYKVKLMPGLSDEELISFSSRLPLEKIPEEIKELLKFSRGFEFLPLQEITFDAIGQFGMENIFPHSVQLTGDGFGNFWILDISSQGDWGAVFYVCHDPAVIIKQAHDLGEFIRQIDDFGKKGKDSYIDIVHEKTTKDVWNNSKFISIEDAQKSANETVRNFSFNLPKSFFIADISDDFNRVGFAWGKFGPGIDNAVRYKDAHIWAFNQKTKKSFLSRIFG